MTVISHRLSDAQKNALRDAILKRINEGIPRTVLTRDLAHEYDLRPRLVRAYVRKVAGAVPENARFSNKLSEDQRHAIKAEIASLLKSGIARAAIVQQLALRYKVNPVSIYHYFRQVAQMGIVLKEGSTDERAMTPEPRRRGRPRKHPMPAQPGATPVRTVFVDGARAELILRRGCVDQVIALLVYHDESKLMNAIQRSLEAASVTEAHPHLQ